MQYDARVVIVRTMTTTTAIGYVRVSSDEQVASGLGLDSQRQRIEAYCLARGWNLADTVTDAGVSARTLNRPGMDIVRRLMTEQLVDVVVALKLDRLTRSVRDLHQLLQLSNDTGVGLVSVSENMDTTSAAGRLMVNMLAAMAEWEREVISERTIAALAVKKARGERVSRYPLMGREAEPRGAVERETLAVVAELLAGPPMTQRGMASALASRGYLARSGRPYCCSSIIRMIARAIEDHPQLAPVRNATDTDARAERITAVVGGGS